MGSAWISTQDALLPRAAAEVPAAFLASPTSTPTPTTALQDLALLAGSVFILLAIGKAKFQTLGKL